MSSVGIGATPASIMAQVQVRRQDGRVELHEMRFDLVPTLTQIIPTQAVPAQMEKNDGGNAQ